MAYVDYCLIVNSYGKNLGKENPWQSLENNKYDLRIIIVIICLWYHLKNPVGKTRDMTYVYVITASLKTFYEKPWEEKLIKEKSVINISERQYNDIALM